MFPNLEAEQARARMTNSQMAAHLGISRTTYENKKKSGLFNRPEIVALLKLFGCSFDYLFATDEDISSNRKQESA
jgi:DNA-binding XRE family transcriptional regulator